MLKSEAYPRSTPYRRPDGTAPQPAAATATPVRPASNSRQSLLMVGVCGLFLLAGLGIGLFVMGRTNRPDSSANEKEQPREPEKKGRLTEPLDDSLRLAGGRGDRDVLPPVTPPTGKESPAPRLQAPEQQPAGPLQGGKLTSQPGKPTAIPEAVVEALGGLTAS